jgi:hypothetical protein
VNGYLGSLTLEAIAYPFDGSFTKTIVQERGASRAEQKASFTIAIGQNYGSIAGVVFPSQFNSFRVDDFVFSFNINHANTVDSNGVYVRTPDFNYSTPNAPDTAAAVWLLLTSFTSPTSGIGYNVRTANGWIEVTTAGTETRNGDIPQMISMNYRNVWTTAGVTALPARSEIVDFTPLNPRTGEVFSLSLSGQTYTATGTTVSEIISGILAAMVADPSPVGNCVDNTTKITCTSINSSTSLSSLSSVTYPSPDTTAPIVTLVGSSTGTVFVGASYTELWATWIDNRDGSGTVSVPYSGSVNIAQPGTYVLSYRHIDTASNTGNTVIRTIAVSDVTPPVITVLWSGSVTQELDLPYTDAGATWSDDVDGSGTLTASGISLMTGRGTYTLTYEKRDAAGNVGTGSREVVIVDTIAPVVTLSTLPVTVDASIYQISGRAPWSNFIDVYSGSTLLVSTTPVDGYFSVFVPLAPSSANTFLIEATDTGRNTGTWQVVITTSSAASGFSGTLQVSGSTLSGVTTFSGASFSVATQVTVQAPILFTSSSGGTSVIPTGTVITGASGTVFDASAINALSVTVTWGLASNQTPNGALEFGISGTGLYFSRPIKIQIPVSGYSGTTIPVRVKHGGTSTYVTSGLTNNPNSTCTNGVSSSPSAIATVRGGFATIYTCAASTFVAYTETAVSSGGGSGWGGGGGGSYIATPLASTGTTIPSVVILPTPVSTSLVSSSGWVTTITTSLPNGTRVLVSVVSKKWKKSRVIVTRVKDGKISFKTRKTGTFQVKKIGK